MERTRRTWRALIIVLLGALVLLLAPGAAVLFANWLGNRPIPFDQAAWNADMPNDSADRGRNRMAYGLVETGALIGKSLREIVEMLGQPDQHRFHPEIFDVTYALGQCGHLIGIDTEFLVLKFNALDQVAEAGIAED